MPYDCSPSQVYRTPACCSAGNLGTGAPAVSGRSMKPATHTVHHGAGGQSRLTLPAGPQPPSGD